MDRDWPVSSADTMVNEHAAHLKNRYMVGANGRTQTERLRGRGVQRPVNELGEKVLFLPLAPAR